MVNFSETLFYIHTRLFTIWHKSGIFRFVRISVDLKCVAATLWDLGCLNLGAALMCPLEPQIQVCGRTLILWLKLSKKKKKKSITYMHWTVLPSQSVLYFCKTWINILKVSLEVRTGILIEGFTSNSVFIWKKGKLNIPCSIFKTKLMSTTFHFSTLWVTASA